MKTAIASTLCMALVVLCFTTGALSDSTTVDRILDLLRNSKSQRPKGTAEEVEAALSALRPCIEQAVAGFDSQLVEAVVKHNEDDRKCIKLFKEHAPDAEVEAACSSPEGGAQPDFKPVEQAITKCVEKK